MKSIENIPNIYTILENFTEEYNIPPYDSYISYFDVKPVGELDENITDENEKNEPCLIVKLRDKLPPGLEIPASYRGTRVFVR
jgi:hypothetical protein